MKKFKLYAGCFRLDYHGIFEFSNREEALAYAYQLAEEDYQSYEGSHGIMSYEDCYNDCKESGWLDGSEQENEDTVQTHYLETIEGQIKYDAIEVVEE